MEGDKKVPYTINGEIISKVNCYHSSKHRIDISDLKNGVYVIKASSKNGSSILRVLKI